MEDNWDKAEKRPDAASVLYDMYLTEKRKREKIEKELAEVKEKFSKFGKDICEAVGVLYDSRCPIKVAAETLAEVKKLEDEVRWYEAELKRYEDRYRPDER
jgi:tetrahydromethanopterin S-methyltransferase subunit G